MLYQTVFTLNFLPYKPNRACKFKYLQAHHQLVVFSGYYSSTNKTDHPDITEILLRLALNTINQTNPSTYEFVLFVCLETFKL
jgi:hypothetical protein